MRTAASSGYSASESPAYTVQATVVRRPPLGRQRKMRGIQGRVPSTVSTNAE
ncbi:hypothetical protein [Streptomyces sp. KL116D]|uniref:hypothetical protein n=1 Tax=Streptomyces sp. KL116D TaxID=3045152 RepID=UPI003555C5F2